MGTARGIADNRTSSSILPSRSLMVLGSSGSRPEQGKGRLMSECRKHDRSRVEVRVKGCFALGPGVATQATSNGNDQRQPLTTERGRDWYRRSKPAGRCPFPWAAPPAAPPALPDRPSCEPDKTQAPHRSAERAVDTAGLASRSQVKPAAKRIELGNDAQEEQATHPLPRGEGAGDPSPLPPLPRDPPL
jgi:hypothetical protein